MASRYFHNNTNFRSFSNWQVNRYTTTADLLNSNNTNDIIEDILQEDSYFFRDKNGCAINYNDAQQEYENITPKRLLLKEITNEKYYLAQKLEYLSHFTPLASILAKNACFLFGSPRTQNSSANNVVLHHCANMILFNAKMQRFEMLIERIKDLPIQRSKLEGYFIYRSPIFLKNRSTKVEGNGEQEIITPSKLSLNPWNWKACNSNRATKLYYAMLKRYLWLLVIEYKIQNWNNGDESSDDEGLNLL